MPLLDRKEHPPGARVPPTNADEVFVIRCTGEVVLSYEEYTHKRNLYARHDWSDKYHGRGGLTYEEALRIEEQTESLLNEQFPKELEETVVKQIHHSRLRKDDLITQIHGSLKPSGLKPADSGKENGTLPTGTPGAPPVTKKLLGLFLVYVADKLKPGIWVCKDPWAQKYGLLAELPDGLQLATTQPSSPRNTTGAIAVAETTPMKSPVKKNDAADKQPAPVRTLEEEEARLRPGSMKAVAFNVLKARGTQPTSADDIIRISTIDGTRTDWSDNAKKQLGQVLGSDNTFTRVARGQYVLTALANDLPMVAEPAAASGGGGKSGSAAVNSDGKAVKADREVTEAPEVAGLARAEQLLTQAQKAVAARQADLRAADEQLQVCEKRLREGKHAKSQNKSSPAKSAEAQGLPSTEELDQMFALPEDLRAYKGAEDDRKAKSSWRQEKAKKEKELAAARAKYLQQQRLKAAKEAGASLAGLQQAYDRAKKTAEEASAKLGKALKAEAEAKRAVEKEKQREMLKGIKEKAKEDKEKQKQAEKEEREKRRQEALAAKRYPIDDLELLFEELTSAAAGTGAADGDTVADKQLLPAQQLDLTCLSEAKHLEQTKALEMGQMLYVADTLSQFSKQLGVRGCSHAELASMLAAAAVGAESVADAGELAKEQVREALQWLGSTYHQLMKVLVEDVTQVENSARVFDRWLDALECGTGSWPELAQRWVSLQEQDHLASPEATAVAEFLRTHEASELTPQQHLILLTQLLDDCLDTYRIRDVLANRIEKGAELAAEIRAELADGRKKLRELADTEKESRKKKRAAALALATAAAERQLREKGEMPANGAAEDAPAADAAGAAASKDNKGADVASASGTAASGGGKEAVARKIQATTKEILSRVAGAGATNVTLAELEAELAGDVEEEPSWELPAELQQYSGPEGDKKLMSEFRRKQQEVRKKLDKERAKWQAGKAERMKARAEAKKKEVEAERRLQADRKRAEQELAEQQEALELKLEKYLVRRQPLGNDRYNRMYWWGLAGNKDGLLLQQETGSAEATWKLLQEAALEAAAQQRESAKENAGPAPMDVDGQQAQHCPAGVGSPAGTMNGDIKQESGRTSFGDEGKDELALSWPLQHTGLQLPAGPEGWAVIDDVQLLEGLLTSLEQRGVREKELKQTIEKMLPAITSAISKAAAAKAAAEAKVAEASSKKARKEKEPVVQRELPSRHARAAAAEQIKKTGSASKKDEPTASSTAAVVPVEAESAVFSGWQLAATKNSVDNLQELSSAAEAAKISSPYAGSSWSAYKKQLDALLQGEVPAAWAEETATAAAALLTSGATSIADTLPASPATDAAWSKVVKAAAAAAAGASDAGSDDARQAAKAAVVVAQLRLQLLAVEQQLVDATGELPYLYQGSAAAEVEDEADAESEGEVEDSEQQAVQQQQQRSRGKQNMKKTAKATSSKAQSSQQDAQDEATHALDVDQVQQQLPAQARSADTKGKSAAASSAGRRGTKRAASAVSTDGTAAVEKAGYEVGSREEAGGRSSKRRKSVAAAADLPPRPSGHGARKPTAAASTGAAGEEQGSPVSHEGSAAPACSSDAAGKGGASRKRTHGAAVASRANSEEPEQVQDKQQRKQKKGNKAVAARKGQDSAQQTGSAGDGDVSDADDDQELAGKRRHSLPHHKHDGTEQFDDPDEEVAEEGDDVALIRLRGKVIWMHGDERDSWRASVAASATSAGLSYLSAALLFHTRRPLEALAAAKAAAGKKGGKKK